MYIELHARSAFSFLEGASMPEELAAICAEHGMPAMALARPRRRLRLAALPSRREKTSISRAHRRRSHLSGRLALSLARRIARGLSESLPPDHAHETAREERRRPRLTRRSRRSSAGLICLTGGDEGPLAHALAHGGIEAATACVGQLCEIFGRDNVYVELQRHFCREEEARNQAAVEIARKLQLAAARHQRRLLRAAAAARSPRRLHLHPPSPHARRLPDGFSRAIPSAT